MAFDSNSVGKSLRPLNVAKTVVDDPQIAPPMTSMPTEGFYANPHPDIGVSAQYAHALYYPAGIPDAGFVNLGFNNAFSGNTKWVQNPMPSPIQPGSVGPVLVNSSVGYPGGPCVAAKCGDGACDHSGVESSDYSGSGHKVKFLCSFGGKILPRPSDGTLRYVGGQTRIIGVRRGASFNEFVQKMMDACGQNVVIKYQLPDEDLDALVSISGPDDLENMMDEYEKMIDRSSDGSAKLRIFLFSPSELELADLMHMGDLQDGGRRYVEAVNGIMDEFSSSARIARKESIESASSAQNSDLSGTEGADSISPALGEAMTVPLTLGFSSIVHSPGNLLEFSPRMGGADPNADPSATPLGIPMFKSSPTAALGATPEQEVERSVPLIVPSPLHGMGTQPSTHVHACAESSPETLNPANYRPISSQIWPSSQMFGVVGPVYTQQPIPAVASPQQFPHPVNMSMNPAVINSGGVSSFIQSHHVGLEHYPPESAVHQRVIQLSSEQGYNTHHAHFPPTAQGVYWHQFSRPEPVVYSDGGLPVQRVVLTDTNPGLEDCYMCQKALPHAHSDTVAQGHKEIPASILADPRTGFRSLRLDDQEFLNFRPSISGPPVEGSLEQLASGAQPSDMGNEDRECGNCLTDAQNVSEKYMDEKTINKLENAELSKLRHPRGIQADHGMLASNAPQYYQTNVSHPQYEVMQGTSSNKLLNNEFSPLQSSDVFCDYPLQYFGKGIGENSKDDSSILASDHLKQIDGRLENLHVRPSEILVGNEKDKSIANFRKNDLLEAQQKENNVRASSRVPTDRETVAVEGNQTPFLQPSSRVGDAKDNSASLFSNQDPWKLRLDAHYPPPKPSKIIREIAGTRDHLVDNRSITTGESPTGNCLSSVTEPPVGNAAHSIQGELNQDFNLDHIVSSKVPTGELVTQELQAVAEDVAASVRWSDSPPSALNSEMQQLNGETEHKDKFKDIKAKLPEINFGFPTSDGIGQLQIIKNADLEELRELGSGTFGTVYHGKWRGTDVAIKRINDRCFAGKPSEQERMRDDFWNEAIKLGDLHHPNVVAFYGVVLDGPDGTVATVTEFMVNGSLRNALQKSERNFDKRKSLIIAMDVAFGMEYLHGKNIVHFDLKSDNLLVNLRDLHRPICKVGDLGLSKVKCQTLISGGVRGTLPWMAPELLNGSSSLVSEKVDVFSYGIVMWELLTGEEPYADLHYGAIIGGIVSNTLRPPVPDACDPDWRNVMERCWSSEPSERPHFSEIASELRAMAAKLPPKGQAAQQQVLATNSQVKC